MPQLAEAVARYHALLENPSFRDLAWAEELQDNMRRHGLTDSGRLIAPVLRPHFLSRAQLAKLRTVAERLSRIVHRIEVLTQSCPDLLARMRMLPAEKVLASASCGYSQSTVACRMDAAVHNGTLAMNGVETCKPAGFAYAESLGDLFSNTPVMQEFKRTAGCPVAVPRASLTLLNAIQNAWSEYGGTRAPNIAIVEFRQGAGDQNCEGELLTHRLAAEGASVQLATPEELEYENGKLRSGKFVIDVVYRRLLTRELLLRFDMKHPLLQAYRDRAVCVVNGFRSEAARRRALFELLTDDAVTSQLSASDRHVIRDHVPWTRVVSARKTRYKDEEIDLLPFLAKNRQHFVLRPNDDSDGHQSFVGAQIPQSAWDQALKSAAQAAYVAQQYSSVPTESFPVLQYGEVQMKQAAVSVHPHILDGGMQGVSAHIECSSGGSMRPLALAPVVVISEN
jgi:hypothetical protein